MIARVYQDEDGLNSSRVIHFDGDAWTEIGDFATWNDPVKTGRNFELFAGCAIDRDEVWVVGKEEDFLANNDLIHWDGERWERRAQGSSETFFADLVCAAGRPWMIENWYNGYLFGPDGAIQGASTGGWYEGLWIDESGDGWFVGDVEKADEDPDRGTPQIWRWSNEEVSETVMDGLESLEVVHEHRGLRTVWQDAHGRVFVFGNNGLVYQGTDEARNSPR